MSFLPIVCAATLAAAASPGTDPVLEQVRAQHDATVRKLQAWIARPSIAAEDLGYPDGADHLAGLLREAGFQRVERVPTDGKPGLFATLDAGAPKTVGLYFMYDVKQADPREWSSPPFEGRLVDKPGLGKAVVGRGAVNQKGPEMAFLAALNALKAAGRRPPVNLVLVAEGEEEIGSPHFAQVVRRPEVAAALAKTSGVFMPFASQGLDGAVTVNLGAKGIIELELVASGEKWGRGPSHDVHSSLRAALDSPAFHLVQALASLVTPDGTEPAIDGWFDGVRPLSPAEEHMLDVAAQRLSEADQKKQLGVQRWVHDLDFRRALEREAAMPTVNIEGLVAGYTGPGGKTVLPHRAVAKMDFRLVPGQTREGQLAKLKAHLAKHGFGDLEVEVGGGYDPNTTPVDAPLIQAELATYRAAGIDPVVWPRLAGSWPGYLFTEAPLRLAAAHFGLGHGSGAHAPNEYFVVDSANPKIQGLDGAVRSYLDFLQQLAK